MNDADRQRRVPPRIGGAASEGLASPRDALRRGELLGRYVLLCPIARGGMGEVWAAQELGRSGSSDLVAIKLPLQETQAVQGEFEDSLYDEARVAALIDHPNVCKTLELVRERGLVFLAMEWIHGAPLSALQSALAPANRLDFALAALVCAQAAAGLHAAHELRDDDGVLLDVVHRDATPHNLLISTTGDVKVVDFGIAKARNQQRQVTEVGAIKGKLPYLTPEQLSGRPVDRRTDIYMLGCVLYAISTGRNAFDSRDPARTLMQISLGECERPAAHVQGYPERLEAIVKRAMALDPDKRFRTADEMRLALDVFAGDQRRLRVREELALVLKRCCGESIEARRAEIRAAERLIEADPTQQKKRSEAAALMRAVRAAEPPAVDTRHQGAGAMVDSRKVAAGPPAAGPPAAGPAPAGAPPVPPLAVPPLAAAPPAAPPATAERSRIPDSANVFARVPGIRGCCVGNRGAELVNQHGEAVRAVNALSASAYLARELEKAATPFQLGGLELFTSVGSSAAVVLLYRPHSVVVVDVDPGRPLKNVEFALRSTDWESASEWEISDQDIEYLSSEEVTPIAQPSPLRRAGEQTGVATLGARAAGEKTNKRSVAEDWAELRRALIKGQLSSAQRVAARVHLALSPREFPLGSADMGQMVQPLLEAIASILAGDNQSGLKKLELLVETAQIGPSLKWAAQVWSARASANTGDGLEAARVYAESSLRLAERLDPEALAVSTLVVAEVMSHAGEWSRVLKLTTSARALFVPGRDNQELAACWLLEARALATLERKPESVQAAEQAQQCRPSWPPAVTFLVKNALGAGRVTDAERALATLLGRKPLAAEAERDRRLIEHVRSGQLSAAIACQYLELLEARADAATIQKLEDISNKYPRIAQFRETLGWKLLRGGRADAARVVFERLSARGDLPDDLRASVLLGLGCLATAENSDEHPSTKLRAAVNAGPRHPSARPPAPPAASSPKAKSADLLDFRLPASLPPSGSMPADIPTAELKAPAGPVFSGSLEMFALPDLLEFLRAGQRTGTLVCSSVAGIGAVHLRAGKVTGAASPKTKDLSEYLLARGAVTREQLQRVQELTSGQPEALVGAALVKNGIVKPARLREALRDQILAALGELITWGEGQFAFNPENAREPAASEIDIELDPQALLLEMFKEMDEQSHGSP